MIFIASNRTMVSPFCTRCMRSWALPKKCWRYLPLYRAANSRVIGITPSSQVIGSCYRLSRDIFRRGSYDAFAYPTDKKSIRFSTATSSSVSDFGKYRSLIETLISVLSKLTKKKKKEKTRKPKKNRRMNVSEKKITLCMNEMKFSFWYSFFRRIVLIIIVIIIVKLEERKFFSLYIFIIIYVNDAW